MHMRDKLAPVPKLSIFFEDPNELREFEALAVELGLDEYCWPMEMLRLFLYMCRRSANDKAV